MRKLFLIAAALALVTPAGAADIKLITKAPVSAFVTGGWYMGLGTAAATDKGQISSPELGTTGDITTAGAALEGIAGYHKGTAESFWDVELAGSYWNLGGVQNQVIVGAANSGIASMNSRISGRATLKIGGTQTYANLLGVLGNLGGGIGGVLTPPALGPSSMPYAALDLKLSKIQASLGALDALGNPTLTQGEGSQLRPGIGLGNYAAIMNTITGKPTGCMMDTSVHYYPAGKGIAFGGSGSATFGREFEARLAMVC